MSDEAAATTTDTAAPAATEAAPAKPSGKPESFAQSMKRLGGGEVFQGQLKPDGPASDAKADKGEAKQAARVEAKQQATAEAIEKAAETATPSEMDQLKQLAEKLGMTLEDGRVTVAERHQFREQRRLAKLEQDQERARWQSEMENARRQFQSELEFAQGVGEFKKTKDFEKLAKTMGYENWNKLQEEVIAHATDPNYRRIRELEEREEARVREAERQAQEARVHAERQQQLEAQRGYQQQLSRQMAESKDPLVKAMADDPSFVAAVFRVQQEHWDGVQTVTPEQAANMAARGAAKPLRAELRALYDRLAPIFTAPPAAEAAKAAPRPATRAPAVPPPRASKVTKHDPKGRDWFVNAAARLNAAQAEDERRANGGDRT